MQHHASTLGFAPADFDWAMENFAARHGLALDRGLLKYLKPKLRARPATRHALAGRAAADYLCETSRQPEQRLSLAEWPSSAIPLLRDGHAVSLIVYPDLPAAAALSQIRDAVRVAKKNGRGIWRYKPSLLLPSEYRWIAAMIIGKDRGPELYCGDFTNRKLCAPQQYYRVPEENRVWFCRPDVGAALKLGYVLQ